MCFEYGKKGHLAWDCLNKKNDSKSAKLTAQNQKENARVFDLTEQDANAGDQVIIDTILVYS